MQLEQTQETIRSLIIETRRALEAGSVQHATKHLLQAIRLCWGEQEAAASMNRVHGRCKKLPTAGAV
eukprot:1142874-Pelagomonas_calceolata.AAC.2